MKDFYCHNIEEVVKELRTSARGLSEVEAKTREKFKPATQIKKQGLVSKFFEQFFDFMIVILLIASGVSIVIGIVERHAEEIIDGCIILAIVIMNAVFGVVQEYKAEKSLEALAKLTQAECMVLRDGVLKKIPTQNLVVGDVVALESGSILPADVRLIESHQLKIDESSLTGESEMVEKDCNMVCTKDCPIGERRNMAFSGTNVGCGRGLGVVVALGEDSEFGKIAKVISEKQKELTPLQKSIKDIGKVLTYLVLIIAVVTFVLEICITPNSIMDAFLTAVAIAVAAIPESMPAVITIIMSMGVARLAKQKAIVRKMHSVETLGCCEVICSDKTGTITQNKMVVEGVFCGGKLHFDRAIKGTQVANLAQMALLCNDAKFENGWLGDPTEIALAEFGEKHGLNKSQLEKTCPRFDEIPFDSARKLMSVLCNVEGRQVMICKGAPEGVLDRCRYILIDGKIQPLSQTEVKEILRANDKMCERALRTLGFAIKAITNKADFDEENMAFVGLVGMKDPPRKEIKKAIQKCRRAGMKPVMITGDYSTTALAIAKEIGLAKSEKEVATGTMLAQMSDAQLEKEVENFSVFARVSPQDKVRIVEAFKKRGRVVAMTGDGVNDAPSLKKANIGIGMGKTGTDVAKEVADIIVADDNFATIVVAVEEGRKIYQNIQKTVKFLFSANLAELLSLFVVTLLYPQFVFLFPVQILFVNLITDSLPAIALGVEQPEENLMDVPPRDSKKGLFSGGIGTSIVVLGLVQTLLVVLAYVIGINCFGEGVAVTMAFYTLNIIQFFYLASMRTNAPFYKSKPHKNKMFLLAVAFCFGLVALFALTPLRNLLKLSALSPLQWGIIFALSIAMLLISELYKLCEKLIKKKKEKASHLR
ncbi:MAG: calcium-translocating P-type ATPase, PMCA-type [Clostridia bacterium]|nr:calcium-translocating P-type ATPase, PMCA-type [Clostridia bacterium]